MQRGRTWDAGSHRGSPGSHSVGGLVRLVGTAMAGWLILSSSAGAEGTGFLVSPHGHVITNHHVAAGCWDLRTEVFGETRSLRFLGSDAANDLALLQLTGRLPGTYATFREGRAIRPGDDIVAVGFPLRGILAPEANVTTGSVSASAGPGNDARFLQVSAPIQAGSSGGPVLDRAGNVAGVVFAKLDSLAIASVTGDIPQNVNFAIKAQVVTEFLRNSGIETARAASSRAMSAADIGDVARGYTLFIECADGNSGVAASGAYGQAPQSFVAPMPGQSGTAARFFTDRGALAQNYGIQSRSMVPPTSNLSAAESRAAESRATESRATPAEVQQRPHPPKHDKPADPFIEYDDHAAAGQLGTAGGTAVVAPARLAASRAEASPALSGHWQVQVGAYKEYEPAHEAAVRAGEMAPGKLSSGAITIVTVETGKGTLFRARIAGLSRDQAGEACKALIGHAVPCIVLPPNAR